MRTLCRPPGLRSVSRMPPVAASPASCLVPPFLLQATESRDCGVLVRRGVERSGLRHVEAARSHPQPERSGDGRVRPNSRARLHRGHCHPSYDGQSDPERLLGRRLRTRDNLHSPWLDTVGRHRLHCARGAMAEREAGREGFEPSIGSTESGSPDVDVRPRLPR